MSKNITIKQDGETQIITIDKLRTSEDGGGTNDWIPEENMNVANLTVWRNGTYTAEGMGVFGFDLVKVGINGHGGAGASLDGDPHIGEFTAHDVDIQEGEQSRIMGGTKRLLVNKQGGGTIPFVADDDVETATLSATSNGNYRARNSGAYAFTSVTVNVQDGGGGGGGGDDPDDPYAPQNLPKYIAGGPLQIVYEDGEAIVFHNGDVKAYKEVVAVEGQNVLWISPQYPDGGIPVSELSINPTTAIYDESYDEVYVAYSVLIENGLSCGPEVTAKDWYGDPVRWYFTSGSGMIAASYDFTPNPWSSIYYVAASANPGAIINGRHQLNNEYTYDNKTVYYCLVSEATRYNEMKPNCGVRGFPLNNPGPAAWTMIYGTVKLAPTRQEINVSWRRPVDGQTLSTVCNILVEKTAN